VTLFRETLTRLPLLERDAFVDATLGLAEVPADGPALPRDGVAYLPCPVDALLEAIEGAGVGPDDVVLDLGAGVGRALAVFHLVTGARGLGVEVQPELVRAARPVLARWPALSLVEGDVLDHLALLDEATVLFLYCPFAQERLERVLAALSRHRPLRVCAVDLPITPRPGLELRARTRAVDVFVTTPSK
jgi:SAM-dependent methyltransferase